VAVAAASGTVLVAVGLPLLAARAFPSPGIAVLALVHLLTVVGLGAAFLFRGVADPVERMLAVADRLRARGGELPALGPPGEAEGPALHRVALAFERTGRALEEERARVALQLAELERANRELAGAQESLVRSEKLATVGRLAAGVAHEVGNPLGAVCGYAELARSRLHGGGSTAEVADFLARIAAEAQRIDRIVRDLLDFARPADLRLEAVALAPVVEGAIRLAAMQPRARDVSVEVRIADDVPPVRADERRLAQVFLNLLLNASDAMDGGGLVRLAARRDGTAVVVVEVVDGGPGFPSEHLSRVFEPFFSTKAPGRGTGLGLAVCHGIVSSFGGEIAAGNAVAGGAVITLRLPVA
jgi:C4-dicarboxylate-specific signal transduction histidine kinase